MKKTLFSCVTVFLVFNAFSQQARIGLQGGLLSSKVIPVNDVSGMTYQNKLGYSMGVMVGVDIGTTNFSVLTELNYISKGYQFAGVQNPGSIKYSGVQRINYMELQPNILYYAAVGKSYIFLGGGPYLAGGISGKTKTTYQLATHSEISDEPVDFGNSSEQVKRIDYGLNVVVGYKLGIGSSIKLNYTYGMANFSNSSSAEYKHRYIGLTFGYFFGYIGADRHPIMRTVH